MGTITRSTKSGGGTNLNAGQTALVADVNTDMNAIFTEINGELDDANVKTAEMPGSKSFRFSEISSPTSPSANDILLFAKDWALSSRTNLFARDSDGIETLINSFALEAFNTTETTNASGADTDIITVTTNIPTTAGFLVIATFRKTSGAAAASTLGLKLNTTIIRSPFACTSATNQAETGITLYYLGRQATNYLRTGIIFVMSAPGGPSTTTAQLTADLPNAAITSVIMRGNSGNASITFGVQDVFVYRLSG